MAQTFLTNEDKVELEKQISGLSDENAELEGKSVAFDNASGQAFLTIHSRAGDVECIGLKAVSSTTGGKLVLIDAVDTNVNGRLYYKIRANVGDTITIIPTKYWTKDSFSYEAGTFSDDEYTIIRTPGFTETSGTVQITVTDAATKWVLFGIRYGGYPNYVAPANWDIVDSAYDKAFAVAVNEIVAEDSVFEGRSVVVGKDGRLMPTSSGSGELVVGTSFADKCAEFTNLLNTESNVDCFLYFTDPHLAEGAGYEEQMRSYLKTMGRYFDTTPVSFALSGGDWMGNSDLPKDACFKLGLIDGLMRRTFGTFYHCVGNHDTNEQGKLNADSNTWTGMLPVETVRNIWNREHGKNYFSFPCANATGYVLDCYNETQTMNAYRWEQIAWLAEKLKQDDTADSFIVMHIVFTDTAGTLGEFASNVVELISAYNKGGSVTLSGTTYDFTGCTGAVRFVLSGHIHADYSTTVNGIPLIATINVRASAGSPSFDLVFVDWTEKRLTLKRIGSGADQEFDMYGATPDIETPYVLVQGANFNGDGFNANGFWGNRMVLCSETDTGVPIRDYGTRFGSDRYYAAKFPDGATKIKITCPGFKFGLGECDNTSGGYAWRKVDSGWQTSGTELALSGNYAHFIVLFESLNGDVFVDGEEYDVSNVTWEFS